MELEGLKRALATVKSQEVTIKTLITDRHAGVKKYIRENEKDIAHRFDCWHMATSMYGKSTLYVQYQYADSPLHSPYISCCTSWEDLF